jgi:hypothetical protein
MEKIKTILTKDEINSILLDGNEVIKDGVRYIRGILKRPNEYCSVVVVSSKLESLQEMVDGWIEIVAAPFYKDIDFIINEEGKYQENCKPNIYLPEYDDILCGTLIAVGFDMDTSNHVSLTDEQIEYTLNYIKANYIAEEEGKEIDKQDYVYFKIF